MQQSYKTKPYTLDPQTRDVLIEGAPLMDRWSKTECKPKDVGGMEEWAKTHKGDLQVESCDWYHGTWQYLRLLDMVATPPWYAFYNDALSTILRAKPDADVLISAAADFGMAATLIDAIKTAGTKPSVTLYDICNTPLLATKWYAKREGVEIETVRDNIITSTQMPLHGYDLIVTDEFLTVLKAEYKPSILKRWRELLKPGGSVVTTAMIGTPTTPEQRAYYAAKARRLLDENAESFAGMDISREELIERFDFFADVHTRHMLVDERQLRGLFADAGFTLDFFEIIETPGECVNPTWSWQIVARIP
jgi:2-polyprenyl-3-methyl-5-hydroxy-6-metoxy-1,4-benzoquinol methylase